MKEREKESGGKEGERKRKRVVEKRVKEREIYRGIDRERDKKSGEEK